MSEPKQSILTTDHAPTGGVVARFYVSEIRARSYDIEAVEVVLQAVSRGEHNKNWAKWTPAGQLSMTIKNPGAAAWMVERLGKEVQIVFSEAPADD